MLSLEEIRQPVQSEIADFEEHFRKAMHSQVYLLDIITRYIYKRKGKQIRPLFVFLSAKLTGKIGPSTHIAASLIELLHTATLIHDDVVDDADERRGFRSVKALWKNKIAVLVGDFLLSRGLLLALDNNEFELLKIVSEATRQMSEGELLQLEKARGLDISEEIYFEIIRKKTASLIASCCSAGAFSSGANSETVKLMYQFGQAVGIAFQLKDDIFDYEKNTLTGKPNGLDISDKKLTLPLLFLLKNSSYAQRRKIIFTIKYLGKKKKLTEKIVQQVIACGGIDYAKQKMLEYKSKALEILEEFPESEAKQSLRELVDFTIERKN